MATATSRPPAQDIRDTVNPPRGFDQSAMLTSYRVWDYVIETLSALLIFRRGIQRSLMDSPHKGSLRRSLDIFFVVRQTTEWSVVRDAITLMWRHHENSSVPEPKVPGTEQLKLATLCAGTFSYIKHVAEMQLWFLQKLATIYYYSKQHESVRSNWNAVNV